jgi:DNA mismatch repair protein MutS
MKLTPMLSQYLRIKAEHRDAILLFRLGDFYEMFFEDAEVASGILDIALTSRTRGEGGAAIPLCGVPYHAAEPYVARLLGAGWKVAICEQREGATRGLMEREVVRVITPGTILDETSLDPARSNYLAAVASDGAGCGLAVVEFSTGSVRVTEAPAWALVVEELRRLGVREVVVRRDLVGPLRAALEGVDAPVPWALSLLEGHGGGAVDPEPWRARWPLARAAEAAVLEYLGGTHRGALGHLRAAEPYELAAFLAIDAAQPRARRDTRGRAARIAPVGPRPDGDRHGRTHPAGMAPGAAARPRGDRPAPGRGRGAGRGGGPARHGHRGVARHGRPRARGGADRRGHGDTA